MSFNLIQEYLKGCEVKDLNVNEFKEQIVININKNDLFKLIIFLKNHPILKFRQLVDILGVDYPTKNKRFEVIYLLLSHEINLRIVLKIQVEDGESVPSITGIFLSANWLEREVFDMYGIVFENHPDLRRILTDYEFEGFPLRKDFPLTGHTEVRYDDEIKKVIYEPVKLSQAYRNFDFESPWEGSKISKQIQDNKKD
ncbi:MAG: NADH-quinone oxidoreductase subunit C [Candidatus Fonsibacter sp.]